MSVTWPRVRDNVMMAAMLLALPAFWSMAASQRGIEVQVRSMDKRLERVEVIILRHLESHNRGHTGD